MIREIKHLKLKCLILYNGPKYKFRWVIFKPKKNVDDELIVVSELCTTMAPTIPMGCRSVHLVL